MRSAYDVGESARAVSRGTTAADSVAASPEDSGADVRSDLRRTAAGGSPALAERSPAEIASSAESSSEAARGLGGALANGESGELEFPSEWASSKSLERLCAARGEGGGRDGGQSPRAFERRGRWRRKTRRARGRDATVGGPARHARPAAPLGEARSGEVRGRGRGGGDAPRDRPRGVRKAERAVDVHARRARGPDVGRTHHDATVGKEGGRGEGEGERAPPDLRTSRAGFRGWVRQERARVGARRPRRRDRTRARGDRLAAIFAAKCASAGRSEKRRMSNVAASSKEGRARRGAPSRPTGGRTCGGSRTRGTVRGGPCAARRRARPSEREGARFDSARSSQHHHCQLLRPERDRRTAADAAEK